jgi:hypothetical protein
MPLANGTIASTNRTNTAKSEGSEMERQGDEVHIETDEARGGSTPSIVRWVLLGSLLLAIVLLSITWITGAVSMGEQGTVATTTDREDEAKAETATTTDSIVTEGTDEIEGAVPATEAAPSPAAT